MLILNLCYRQRIVDTHKDSDGGYKETHIPLAYHVGTIITIFALTTHLAEEELAWTRSPFW